jgi:hypothetical protein
VVHDVDKTRREIARLLGATYEQFEADIKLIDNIGDVLNEANDRVCRRLKIPYRTSAATTTGTAVPFPADARVEEGVIKLIYVGTVEDYEVPLLTREEADTQHPGWERWIADESEPVFAVYEASHRAQGMIPYPMQATANWRIRYTKTPTTLPDTGTTQVMDGEMPSYHHLVPLQCAILILDRDYFGGEAGTPDQLGGNARKQQKLTADLERGLVDAIAARAQLTAITHPTAPWRGSRSR